MRASPNPFRGSTEISFDAPQAAAAARVEVLDVRGRRVATLASRPAIAGAHRAAWDGRDEGGAPLPAGVYFVRLEGQGIDAVRKVTLLR
jgi:flagellar hook assembly protein FlgD